MRKYILILFAVVLPACSSIELTQKKPAQSQKICDSYQEKIFLINLSEETVTSELLKKKIEDEIKSAAGQNFDALIIKPNIPEWLFNQSNSSAYEEIILFSSKTAQKYGLKFFVEIDFEKINPSKLASNDLNRLKKEVHSLVKNNDMHGFFFNGINFSEEAEIDLFENLSVESMLLKPFQIISISKSSSQKNILLVDEFIKKGIIDFIIDEKKDYALLCNEYITIDTNQKILGQYLKRIAPENIVCLNVSEVVKELSEAEILNEKKIKKITPDKKINFFSFDKNDTLKLKLGGTTYNILKNDWVIPYNYLLHQDNSTSRYGSWIEFRRPFAKNTNKNIYNLLCRTAYPSEVFINGEAVKIYKTGIFFKKIKLTEGLNKIKALSKNENGITSIYEDRVYYSAKIESSDNSKLMINENSIQPKENIALNPKDVLRISFTGTKGQNGFVEFIPGGLTLQCSSKNFDNYCRYEIEVPASNFLKNQKYQIKYVLKPDNANNNNYEKISETYFEIKEEKDFPILTTIQDNSLLTFTLAPIRLGAPIRNELPNDVILKSNGIFGNYYRIKLNETEEGYISNEYVKELAPPIVLPSYFINPIVCYADNSSDIINIPYLENVPYDVFPDPQQKRIIINLYGVKTSSTWIIHRTKTKYIDEVTWQQTSKETYRIYVNLNTSKIWGYELKPNGKQLIFKLKYPPVYELNNSLPLKGIKISIEAGHGGDNYGAVGLSGLKEKDVNLKLSLALEDLLKKNGAEILQIRNSDKFISLVEKRDMVTNSDANIHLSIHANASDPADEFLGTSGTCTFYHNPFWAPLAEKVYYKLIELDLKPFGSVGSFNYRVTRMSEMPAILVEQAFLSHAEDEEKLVDDDFRLQIAEKIFFGLIDYLKYMQD